ncbi:MAG: sulfatase [Synoicihabitans sp.]
MLLSVFLLAAICGAVPTADRPNVIVIMSDDQGSLDLGVYGAKDLHTPNLDALAHRGVMFTQFYTGSAVCSPSRASLLTGKTPQGAGLETNAGAHKGYVGLPPEQVTMAEMLRDQGYATAHVGKWHLGNHEPLRPDDQGFDYSFGHYSGCIDNYSHFFYWVPPNRHDLWENGVEIFENGNYFPELMAERARGFIANQHRANLPFFIYFALNLPHYPLQGLRKWHEYYDHLPMPRRDYAATVSTIDEQIGHLLAELEAYGELDNTIVVFLSDHGHSYETRAFGGGGWAGEMRGSKFGFFEAGVRVPAIIAGPGVPSGVVVNSSAMQMDLLPTLADLVGVAQLPDGVEGTSLTPMFTKDEPLRDTMHWRINQHWAVRQGDWKLQVNPRDESKLYPLDPVADKVFLSNIAMDLSEKENLANKYPDKVRELIEVHRSWQHFQPKDLKELPAKWRP